jgi:hypothetical protein
MYADCQFADYVYEGIDVLSYLSVYSIFPRSDLTDSSAEKENACCETVRSFQLYFHS